MLIAFLAPRVQLAKLCTSGFAQQFAASQALLLCDIRPLLRSQHTRGLKSCSGRFAKNQLAVSKTLEAAANKNSCGCAGRSSYAFCNSALGSSITMHMHTNKDIDI